MPSAEKPLVYLILGTTGSGRREIIADLIEGGLDETDRAAVLLPAGEGENAIDVKLPGVTRWEWSEGVIVGTLPAGANRVFFVTDGACSAVDQIEVFKAWLEAQGGELARVLCVVNAQLAARLPPLLAWFEACIHFSDVVLINKREGIKNKWLSEFLNHFKKLHLPCLFEMVRDDRVKNPALILEPQARRMSQVFDEEQDWVFKNAEGEVIDEFDEGDAADEEIEAAPAEDPYFARRNGGRRVLELPDIASFLRADAITPPPP